MKLVYPYVSVADVIENEPRNPLSYSTIVGAYMQKRHQQTRLLQQVQPSELLAKRLTQINKHL